MNKRDFENADVALDPELFFVRTMTSRSIEGILVILGCQFGILKGMEFYPLMTTDKTENCSDDIGKVCKAIAMEVEQGKGPEIWTFRLAPVAK